MTFHEYFRKLAEVVALKSKDTTKVGCVIVGPDNEIRSTGWNGLPRGVNDLDWRLVRPAKYDWTTHSEANAICNAARHGTALKDCTAYVTHFPCKNCSGLLIQAGIVCVVVGDGTLIGNDYGLEISKTMFEEAGVGLVMSR